MSQSPEYIYSELPAIDLFQKLGYAYCCANKQDERSSINDVILEHRLLSAIQRLNPWMNDHNLQQAFEEVTNIQAASLIEVNHKVWELIRGTKRTLKQITDGEEEFKTVSYIDYLKPENNDFLVVNQMKFKGTGGNSIPDLVVFVNGMPLAVIECKSPTTTGHWEKAYNDLKEYQKYSKKLFYYNQICVGVWEMNGKYGAIGSPEAFFSFYKTNNTAALEALIGRKPTEQDKLLYSLFRKEQLLDIVRHFVIFETTESGTIKKLPRYQQIRATNKAIAKLQETGQGGVVWHTQGSGKSITMAYVARKLQAPEYGFNNPTILVMTDRKDLDDQIRDTFRNVGLKNTQQALSVSHLEKLLRNDYGGIITTTLQKFQESDKETTKSTDQTVQEESQHELIEKHIVGNVLTKITKVLHEGKWVETSREEVVLEPLSQKENIYVLVDEAHRSHYGFLASFMRTVLPKAKFIAFTGTPISKEDKSTLAEFYGDAYIDVYTIVESVADGATVALYYDEGIAKLSVRKEELDKEFEELYKHESEEKKDKLKSEALRKYQLADERIYEICKHLVAHYQEKIYPNKHKAMIVCAGRHAAIKYKQTLEQLKAEGFHAFDSKVVVSLGAPKTDELARDYYTTLEWNQQHPEDQRPLLITPTEKIREVTERFKLGFGDENAKDPSGQVKYDNSAFLIVSDMLLTGYDAPIASCLYLDKPLKEHNLLQAIARVNRSRSGKDAGFIVDYNGVTDYLIQALEIFSGDVRPDDILKNLNEEIPKLELNHTKLVDFFKPMKIDRNYEREKYINEAVLHLEPIDKRDEFKDLLKKFKKSLNIVLPSKTAMRFLDDYKLFEAIRNKARGFYLDDSGLVISKEEGLMLQQLINDHLQAQGVENLLAEPVSIIDKDKFKKEIMNASPATKELKMRNQLKHTIKVGLDRNPDFFKPLAERLEQLLKDYEEKRITQTQLLLAFTNLQDDLVNENKEGNEHGFTTERQVAVYNTMKTLFDGEAAGTTSELFAIIEGELSIDNWHNKDQVQLDMVRKITPILQRKLSTRSEARGKAVELVEVIKKNKHA